MLAKRDIITSSKRELFVTLRRPRNYNGTGGTTHHVSALLSNLLKSVSVKQEERPDLILRAWPEIIGPKLAGMTQAMSFDQGILTIKVKNSSLLSILSQREKPQILQVLKQKFPQATIRNIIFRMG